MGSYLVDEMELRHPPATLSVGARAADMSGPFRSRKTRSWERNGSTLHIRKSTMPEAGQQRIYAALGLDERPGGVRRHTVPVANIST
jgi:hypothetical protein